MLSQKLVILIMTVYNFFCPINSFQNKPNYHKRYLWKTIQKDIIPIAYCEGYLELNKYNIPYKFGISITVDYDMWKTTKWEYTINNSCEVSSNNSSLYTKVTEISKYPSSNQGALESLRINKDGTMYQARFEPIPNEWLQSSNGVMPGIDPTFIAITIKNIKVRDVPPYGINMTFNDWEKIPPYKKCVS